MSAWHYKQFMALSTQLSESGWVHILFKICVHRTWYFKEILSVFHWQTKASFSSYIYMHGVICLPWQVVGSDSESCQGSLLSSRQISTLLFHLYHKGDGDLQEIMTARLTISIATTAVHAM